MVFSCLALLKMEETHQSSPCFLGHGGVVVKERGFFFI